MSGPTYASYLQLDRILSAQAPRSGEHDELLFIVIHQASELWMSLSLHELSAAREHLRADDLGPALKMIARVARIQAQLIQSWDVLATMTPSDYAAIRASLGSSSGFQSAQNRLMEFMLGQKNAAVAAQQPEAADRERLQAALVQPSLYDEALRLLHRRGLPVPPGRVERDWRETAEADPAVVDVWAVVYRDPAHWWDLYDLAEKLVDLDFRYGQWRYAHLKTVERIIGFKSGSGGTAGATYLSAVVARPFFPELLDVRTRL